jgi:hypothetical protein
LEFVVFNELKENSVVDATKGTLEVLVGYLYYSFGNFCVFVHHDVRLEAVVCISVGAESVRGVTKDTFSFRCLGFYASEDGCP